MNPTSIRFWKVALGILILCAATDRASARLGETELQCSLRYGKKTMAALDKSMPILEGGVTETFSYQGWTIRIAFVNGIAVREELMKAKIDPANPYVKDYELEAILAGESEGGTWSDHGRKLEGTHITLAYPSVLYGKTFDRTDGAIGMLRPGGMIVRFDAANVKDLQEQWKKEKDQARKAAVPKF